MVKKAPKKTAKKTKAVASTKSSLLQRLKDLRAERKDRKAELKRHKQTEKARLAKAEQRAVREKALEQVDKAVIKAKKRRSYPGFTLILALLLVALGGAAVWQYRQEEINDQQQEITALRLEIASFVDQIADIEAQRMAEEAKFAAIPLSNGQEGSQLRLPVEWQSKPTQFPGEEQVVGDDNVTMRIITSESRNSVSDFIPSVDYIWTISSVGSAISVETMSLHCERFDTIDNNLQDQQREHQGFIVYCDPSSEEVIIAALASPENYTSDTSGVYFIIEVKDLQQVSFDDIKSYIESYSF